MEGWIVGEPVKIGGPQNDMNMDGSCTNHGFQSPPGLEPQNQIVESK